jgi:hypothetical protein
VTQFKQLLLNSSRFARTSGVAIVNATNETKTINLGGTLRKIKGSQDLGVNNGRNDTEVTLPPLDGVVLLPELCDIVASV